MYPPAGFGGKKVLCNLKEILVVFQICNSFGCYLHIKPQLNSTVP
jgi:hypothetical protein